MKHKLSLIFGLMIISGCLFGQQPESRLIGMVTNSREEVLIGASVFWKDTRQGAVTDTAGRFRIPLRPDTAILVVNYVGYTPQEVTVLPGENNLWVEVSGQKQLKEVTVQGATFGTQLSTIETRNVESITSKELHKAPCCNLSESFQTSGAIDVSFPNALTGAREIQLLGLRGIYSQFLVENRPAMTGIATPFAFDYIPGTWLSGIALAKGASTVKSGFAGLTGQVNAELVNPKTDKPLYINAFTSTEGRGELNVHLNKKGQEFSNGLYLHGSFVQNNWDMNRDNFKDSPNRQQLNGMYRMMYEDDHHFAQFNIQALTDHRTGGQIKPGESGQSFAIEQQNDRVEAWGKYGKDHLFGNEFLQLGNILSASWHKTGAQYGQNDYRGEQRTVFAQSLLQGILGTTDHKFVLAPSLEYDDIQEFVNKNDLSRRETDAGMMAEYTYSHPSFHLDIPDLVVVLGSRLDWNSRFGWLFTPRMSAKYSFTEKSLVRISAGRGYRSPNLVAENISLLASNREFRFAPNLTNEEGWNYGVNYTQEFKLSGRMATFSLDLYRTDFVRQILVDVEQAPEISGKDSTFFVAFYNQPGRSFSNSLLATFQYNLLPGLDVKLVYKWNDVRAEYADGKLKTPPLIARHRGLVTLDYTTPGKKWLFNTYVQIIGSQRLPDNSYIPHTYIHHFPEYSPAYAIWSGQITRKLDSKWEIYAGCENINGFQQHDVIIAANEPSSPYFNGSEVWAPMMRQIGYLGIRFTP